MERVDRNQYFHRAGRSERHTVANRQSRCDNSQQGILYHAARGETDTRRADRHAYTRRRYTKVEARHYETVVQGMRRAVLAGTCRKANIPGIEVCGKTGTAQNRGHDHSVFMGFAPMNDPKIAIAVYVENGGWGADYGVPLGALMMEQYLNGKLSPESEKLAEMYQQRHIGYGTADR